MAIKSETTADRRHDEIAKARHLELVCLCVPPQVNQLVGGQQPGPPTDDERTRCLARGSMFPVPSARSPVARLPSPRPAGKQGGVIGTGFDDRPLNSPFREPDCLILTSFQVVQRPFVQSPIVDTPITCGGIAFQTKALLDCGATGTFVNTGSSVTSRLSIINLDVDEAESAISPSPSAVTVSEGNYDPEDPSSSDEEAAIQSYGPGHNPVS